MSRSVVPTSFQMPLVRPMQVDWTSAGFAAHTESVRLYNLAVARRFAYAYDGRSTRDEDTVKWLDTPMKRKYKSLSYDDLHKTMDDACCFCLEDLKLADCVTTSCQHSFCAKCYAKYKEKTCPCCRKTVVSLTKYRLVRKQKV